MKALQNFGASILRTLPAPRVLFSGILVYIYLVISMHLFPSLTVCALGMLSNPKTRLQSQPRPAQVALFSLLEVHPGRLLGTVRRVLQLTQLVSTSTRLRSI